MLYKGYGEFITEKINTDTIERNIDVIDGLVKDKIREHRKKYLLEETADGQKIIKGDDYYTLFLYTGDIEKYKNKRIVYKIRMKSIADASKIDKVNYPKLVWIYEIIATQALGKVDDNYEPDYTVNGQGTSGRFIVKDLDNIKLLTREGEEYLLNLSNSEKRLIEGVARFKSKGKPKSKSTEAKPTEKPTETKPDVKGDVKKAVEPVEKSKQIQGKSKEEVKKEQEAIAKKNIADKRNVVVKEMSPKQKQEQIDKAYAEKEAKEKKKKQTQQTQTQSQVETGTEHLQKTPQPVKKVTRKAVVRNKTA